MTLTITINMDNGAFDENPGEAARILREQVIRHLENGIERGNGWGLMDVNGNRVGVAKITG